MPTARFEPRRSRTKPWRVRWRDAPSGRVQGRRFADEAEAVAFAAACPSWKHGPGQFMTVAERITANIAVDDNGCWIWQRRLFKEGYGQITLRIDGVVKTTVAHRISYEAFAGPIPAGLHLDHLCRVRACVNPEHLEPVTPRENIMRSPIAQGALNAAKTQCPHGHPYDDENTYLYRGGRICKACQRNHYLRRKAS